MSASEHLSRESPSWRGPNDDDVTVYWEDEDGEHREVMPAPAAVLLSRFMTRGRLRIVWGNVNARAWDMGGPATHLAIPRRSPSQ